MWEVMLDLFPSDTGYTDDPEEDSANLSFNENLQSKLTGGSQINTL